MYKQLLFIALLAWPGLHVFSQRPYSNEFMSIGVGAPALSMANSTVASISDVSAGYWNPAGLARIENKYGLSLMHSEYFAGIAKFDYVGASYKFDPKKTLGVTLLRFGVDDILNTNDLFDTEGNFNWDRIKKFSVADYGFLFSYAQVAKNPNLTYGANVKIIHRIVGKFASAWGFGFDVGIQYHKNNWRFGAVLRDATNTFNAWSFNSDKLEITVSDSTFNTISSNDLELTLPKALLGVARVFTLNPEFSLLAEFNADFTFDGQKHQIISNDFISIDPHIGIELNYRNFMFFRGGIGNVQDVREFDGESWSMQPNIGLGLKFRNFVLDYALTDVGDQSIADYSNIFSLRYYWK
ncbi:MAG: PorV/PorQ family protein [Bacteroidales bacterium]|nr:PorV/PorQ family protein [Bacteroidales bacterium]MCF8458063.1 PorV/PorQ family protein [Bacteroidales bacterium]